MKLEKKDRKEAIIKKGKFRKKRLNLAFFLFLGAQYAARLCCCPSNVIQQFLGPY